VLIAVYILNRKPTRSVEEATPFELWFGKKPAVQHLHPLGCIAYVKSTRPNLSKLKDRVVKIARSSFEVVLQTTKHMVIYPGSGPSLEVIALRLAV
jgi:hypothetical protein